MNSIFIPERFWHMFPNEEVEPITVKINGYSTKGYRLDTSEEKYQETYGSEKKPKSKKLALLKDDYLDLKTEDCSCAYFFEEELAEVDTDIKPNNPIAKQENEYILSGMLLRLDSLAEITGRRTCLHACKDGEVHYPYNDGHIHVIVGGLPPGESKNMWASYIGDTRLHVQGNNAQVRVTGVAHGYGRVVVDSSGNKVAQVVGDNLYLCLPIGEKYLHLFAANGAELFSEVLQLAWNALVDVNEATTLYRMTKEDYLEYSRQTEKFFSKGVKEDLKKLDEELEQLRNRVQDRLIHRRILLKKGNTLPEIFSVSTEEAESGWKKLSEHELVNFLERSEDQNLHVHTNDLIVFDDEGLARNLGRFIIRVVSFGDVTIWSERLTHPQQIPHPHISIHGSVCFGNVTSEVDQLAGESKEAELVCLILLWLKEGYDAELADAKLEEWPLVSEMSERTVRNLDTVFLSRKSCD